MLSHPFVLQTAAALHVPPLVAALLLFLAVSFVLWLAREQAHGLLRSVFEEVAALLGRAAQVLMRHAEAVRARAVQLATEHFLTQLERRVRKEHGKLEHVLEKEVREYPTIHRSIAGLVEDYDRLYKQAHEPVDVAPPKELERLSQHLEDAHRAGEPREVVRALEKLRKSMEKNHQRALGWSKREAKRRRKALAKLKAPVKRMQKRLDRLAKIMGDLESALARATRTFEEAIQYLEDRDQLERAAQHSLLTQFLIAAFFFALAAGGSVVNFLLIQRPMAEMVGGGLSVFGVDVSFFAAIVIICVELTAGVVFMDAAGISHVLPQAEQWSTELRRRVMIGAGVLLLLMAGVEAGLAVMREYLVAQDVQTRALLAGEAAQGAEDRFWGVFPVAVQAAMGFVLPLVLALAAIPLDALFHTGRILAQRVYAVLVQLTARLLHVVAAVWERVHRVLASLYDLVIFFWLQLARAIRGLWMLVRGPSPAGERAR